MSASQIRDCLQVYFNLDRSKLSVSSTSEKVALFSNINRAVSSAATSVHGDIVAFIEEKMHLEECREFLVDWAIAHDRAAKRRDTPNAVSGAYSGSTVKGPEGDVLEAVRRRIGALMLAGPTATTS